MVGGQLHVDKECPFSGVYPVMAEFGGRCRKAMLGVREREVLVNLPPPSPHPTPHTPSFFPFSELQHCLQPFSSMILVELVVCTILCIEPQSISTSMASWRQCCIRASLRSGCSDTMLLVGLFPLEEYLPLNLVK